MRAQAEDPAARATDESVDVVVNIASRSGPIAGTVSGPAGRPPSPFHGWLELMDALESLRADARSGEVAGR